MSSDKKSVQEFKQESHGDRAVNIGHVSGGTVIIQAVATKRPSQAEISAVLKKLDGVVDRIKVLEWMEAQFTTRLVKELRTDQLGRLNLYVDKVLTGKKR